MSIQRYSPEAGYSEPMEIDSLGEWVKHKDHLKAMEAKQSEFNGLSKHFKKLNQDCEKLQKELLNRMHEIDAKAAQLEEKDMEIARLRSKIDLLEACRDYDASGKNRPDGYVLANHYVAERQDGKS